MKGYGMQLYFRPTSTMRQILVMPRNKVVKERDACHVYQISDGVREVFHISQTGKPAVLGLWSTEFHNFRTCQTYPYSPV